MSQRHGIHHPPTPRGATERELHTIERLHRAGTTSDDEASRPAMLDGVSVLVELILARDKRQSCTDQWGHVQAKGWTE